MTYISGQTNDHASQEVERLKIMSRRLRNKTAEAVLHFAIWKALMRAYEFHLINQARWFFLGTLIAQLEATVLKVMMVHEHLNKFLQRVDDLQKHLYRQQKPYRKQYTLRIAGYKDSVAKLEAHFANLDTWRDKTVAHIDKEYFDNPLKVAKDFPVQVGQVDSILDLLQEIFMFSEDILQFVEPPERYDTEKAYWAEGARDGLMQILDALSGPDEPLEMPRPTADE